MEGAATSLQEIKAVAVELDPSLSNADAVIQGDTVVFTRRAGTKGADVLITSVVVGSRTYTVDPELYDNPQQIKEALLEAHPEISNYDYLVSEGVMTFIKRAGTKGC